MRFGFYMGLADSRVPPSRLLELALEAEHYGFESIWAAEGWGNDAITLLAWLAARTRRVRLGTAVIQMPARTPANVAMTAATLDDLSGGRFILGLGTSGPQVAEGWHGQPFSAPLQRTREYVAIVRKALAREALSFDGEHFHLPYEGPDGRGVGKALRLMIEVRGPIPIYLAALSPRSVAVASEIADGWLPVFLSPERFPEVFAPVLRTVPDSFEIAPIVEVRVGELDWCRSEVRPIVARYIGGMGSRNENFYNRLVGLYGYEEAALQIQSLYLEGRQEDAIAAVPDALVDEVSLIGDAARIRDRLGAWKTCGVTTLICATRQIEAIDLLGRLAD